MGNVIYPYYSYYFGIENSDKDEKPLNPMEFKTLIMIAKNRLILSKNKKYEDIKKRRNDIINLFKKGLIDSSKLKMAEILRDEGLMCIYDILTPLCEIINERAINIITSQNCPDELRAAIDTIIYASFQIDIIELKKLTEILSIKYGSIFVNNAKENNSGLVNKTLIIKLKTKTIPKTVINLRLKQIAKEVGIKIDIPEEEDKEVNANMEDDFMNDFEMLNIEDAIAIENSQNKM